MRYTNASLKLWSLCATSLVTSVTACNSITPARAGLSNEGSSPIVLSSVVITPQDDLRSLAVGTLIRKIGETPEAIEKLFIQSIVLEKQTTRVEKLQQYVCNIHRALLKRSKPRRTKIMVSAGR